MAGLVDLTGRTFGRLTVIRRSDFKSGQHVYWHCVCSCGKEAARRGDALRCGDSQSCGCLQLEKVLKHGCCRQRSEDLRVRLWLGAQLRAKKTGLPFTILLDDIPDIPIFCPILGITIQVGKGKALPNSPSLDRIIPELGYVPGNVQVISHKANTIKSDATVCEIQKVADFLEFQQWANIT